MRIVSVVWLMCVLCVGVAQAAERETYPARPIRLLIPFAPGGATDIVGRILAPKLMERLGGQQIVVDNRPGAAGNIAVEIVGTAQPDGYTLLVGNISTNSINPILFKSKAVDAPRDLTGITLLASIPNLILIGPQVPANTLKEAIAYAKTRPGQLNFSAPLGSYSHLDMLALTAAAGIKMVHVPSKGAGETVTSLLRGEIHITESNVASNIGAIRGGKVKAVAVTAAQRIPELPDVPTLSELGFKGIGSLNWNGLFAPTKTPKAAIDKLFNATAAILKDPEMQDFMAKRSIPVAVSASPQDFNAYVHSEMQR
ncbi:MAG TPA: tripartite tricarboxylate transporter substrate binding protein, partial [Burkholderiales bacterium]|nr:tripartite tricarboxylate transporter substrate binding protein [Burkholderiales bacterium]